MNYGNNITIITALVLIGLGSTEAQSAASGLKVSLGNPYYSKVPVLLDLQRCSSNRGGTVVCSFNLSLNQDEDTKIRLETNGDFQAVFMDGKIYNPSKISLNSFNNGGETDRPIETTLVPKISYSLQIKFESVDSPLAAIKYLDLGRKDRQYVRLENVALGGAPTTPLPTPQAVANPKQYLTTNASQGFGSISGVSLNGGMYDVTLEGCRFSEANQALCTFSLSPMRAAAQAVTLEDFAVSVNGAAAAASASAVPTVTKLQVTVPAGVNRIDEVRFGNARFLNVAVR